MTILIIIGILIALGMGFSYQVGKYFEECNKNDEDNK